MINDYVSGLVFNLSLTLRHACKEAWPHFFDRRNAGYNMRVQAWSETFMHSSLGFGGMGTNGTTHSHIIVMHQGEFYSVYIGGRFAYAMTHPTSDFREALEKRKIPLAKAFKDNPKRWCVGDYILWKQPSKEKK